MYNRDVDRKRGKKTVFASNLGNMNFFHQKTTLSQIKICDQQEFDELFNKQLSVSLLSGNDAGYIWCSGTTVFRSLDGTVIIKLYWAGEGEVVNPVLSYYVHLLHSDHMGVIEQTNTPERIRLFVEKLKWRDNVRDVLPEDIDSARKLVKSLKKENWPEGEHLEASEDIVESERDYGIFSHNPHSL